jgi:hypothetical protein
MRGGFAEKAPSRAAAAPLACAKEIDGLLCRTARETLKFYRESGRDRRSDRAG